MKKLILLLTILLYSISTFAQFETTNRYQLDSVLLNYKTYQTDVNSDGGDINNVGITKGIMIMLEDLGLMDSTKLLWTAEAGNQFRDDSPIYFFTDGYDISGNSNDIAQSTAGSQPYLSGNIAPNEQWAALNPNGDSRYFTHPEISFAADEPWSVTFVADYSDAGTSAKFLFDSNNRGWTKSNNTIRFREFDSANIKTLLTGGYLDIYGKNTAFTLVADGVGNLSLYVNGIFKTETALDTKAVFNGVYFSTNNTPITFSAHIIKSKAMTAAEVLTEATYLQGLYPPIPSVDVGTQTWATSNLDVVATCEGTVISEVTDNATWATSQTLYDDAITGGASVYDATKAAAMWSYYDNDSEVGATYGKLYNWFAASLIQQDIDLYNDANPTAHWGWHIPTLTEFTTLSDYLGGSTVAGGKMKKEGLDYWNTPNTGADNSSGFSVIGGGFRSLLGVFGHIKNRNYSYSITESGGLAYYNRQTYNNNSNILTIYSKEYGFSIRLIRDE